MELFRLTHIQTILLAIFQIDLSYQVAPPLNSQFGVILFLGLVIGQTKTYTCFEVGRWSCQLPDVPRPLPLSAIQRGFEEEVLHPRCLSCWPVWP